MWYPRLYPGIEKGCSSKVMRSNKVPSLQFCTNINSLVLTNSCMLILGQAD